MHEKIAPSSPNFGPDLGPSLEEELIGKWFPRIGALAIVIGSGFGFKYAIDQGWIGPRLRVMVGLLLSTLLIAIGDWTRKKDWPAYAQAITGGGVALLYLTLWASVEMYHLLPASVAFVCLIAVSGLGCALALRHDSQALALLSVLGGFMNPFVTGASFDMPQGLYLYILTVDLAVVLLSFVRPWRVLEKVAFVSSWFVFELGSGGFTISFIAATGVFLMFGVLPYVRVVLGRERAVTDLAFVPVNGLIYYFAVFVRLTGEFEGWRGPFTLGLAVAFLVGMLMVRGRDEDEAMATSSGVMSFLFLTLWSPIQLGFALTPLGWSIEALLLFAIALRTPDMALRWGGWIVLVMAAATQAVFVTIDPIGALNDNYGRFVFIVLVAALYLGAYLEREEGPQVGAIAVVGANLLSVWWISLEVYSIVSQQGQSIPRSADLQFGLSGVWATYAAALLVAGIMFRSHPARIMALALFGVTLAKMAVHDLWLLDTFQRLIGFLGIGVLLLACSLMYHRFKSFLMPAPTEREL